MNKPRQKTEIPMTMERRLAIYTRQRGITRTEVTVDDLTPRQRRRYLKKAPYWTRVRAA